MRSFKHLALLLGPLSAAFFLAGCAATHHIGKTGPYPATEPTCSQLVEDGRSIYAAMRDIGAELVLRGTLDASNADYLDSVVAPLLAEESVPISVADEVVDLTMGIFPVDNTLAADLRISLATMLAGIVARYDTPAGGDLDPELQAGLQWAIRGLADGLSVAP